MVVVRSVVLALLTAPLRRNFGRNVTVVSTERPPSSRLT
jgi:hypothetical protein